MSAAVFQAGDDLFVRDPQRYGGQTICGEVWDRRWTDSGWEYRIDAIMIRRPPGAREYARFTYVWIDVSEWWFAERELSHRMGTPLSLLSGRPGHPGYDRFVAIAKSWGQP